MERYEIMKEDAILGPFSIDEIAVFVRSGLILKRDYAYSITDPDRFRNVDFFLKRHGKSITVEHRGNVFSQIGKIGKELILPAKTFTKEPWQTDRKLPILAIVGLGLSIVLSIAPFVGDFGIFYIVALYFSVIWGLFFYILFRTDQVKLSITVTLFFITQAVMVLVYYVLCIGDLNPFAGLYECDNLSLALLSCIFGIGIVEEFIKALPVILILYYTKYVLRPQTAVFYGLISGIAFGVFEGVQYQMGPNFQLLVANGVEEGYAYLHISNIARLTSLPFLHAVWSGIAAYFAGFAFLYPRFRLSLFALAVLVPATIHGLYDFLCYNVPFPLVEMPVILVGVVLLMVYLGISYDFHSKLAD